jgi:PHD/YefM family antitoxin component YafN of YafNO toxin-antitoxin module
MQNIDRVLKLVKKTGDKIVVLSEDGSHELMLMPLAEYESLIDLSSTDIKNLSIKQ